MVSNVTKNKIVSQAHDQTRLSRESLKYSRYQGVPVVEGYDIWFWQQVLLQIEVTDSLSTSIENVLLDEMFVISCDLNRNFYWLDLWQIWRKGGREWSLVERGFDVDFNFRDGKTTNEKFWIMLFTQRSLLLRLELWYK